ncbi:serine hydrolase domain-containing protein [Parasphingopyxis lamellibrachiae]|nr:serine hydrolase domain-containing protein [Parasphingopyxis lamellibrachiae]
MSAGTTAGLVLLMATGIALPGPAPAQTHGTDGERAADQSSLPQLRTSEMVVQVQIGNEPEFAWTVVPEISPDKLRVGCTADATTRVSFTSDLESREFTVSGTDFLQFNIVNPDGQTALTEIECIPPRLRFPGDYAVSPAENRDFSRDLNSGTLAAHIEQMVEQRRIPGLAVVVTQGSQTLFQRAFGVGDLESNAPFTSATPVQLASATKFFTGLLMLSLAEDGVIDLAAPLGDYLADAPETWRNVPLWRILNHTSGIPRILADERFQALPEDEQLGLTQREMFAMLEAMPLDFEPGSAMRYQQSGYAILAMAISERTGLNWDELLQEHVFGPAGMTDTRFAAQATGALPVYQLDRGALSEAHNPYPGLLRMGGGYLTTASDMARLFAAIAQGSIVSEAFLESQIFADERIDADSNYSLATIVKTFAGERLIGHSGGGGLADIRYAPGSGVGIAVLSNRLGSIISRDITDEISELLFGEAAAD